MEYILRLSILYAMLYKEIFERTNLDNIIKFELKLNNY